jgi:hypothetical protein
VYEGLFCYRILTHGITAFEAEEKKRAETGRRTLASNRFYRMSYPEALLMLSSNAVWNEIQLYDGKGGMKSH